MRNLLAFLAAITLTLFGVGWYLGWYGVQRESSSPGKSKITIEVDTQKIGDDFHKGGQQVQNLLERSRREGDAKATVGGQEPAESTGPRTSGRWNEGQPRPTEKRAKP